MIKSLVQLVESNQKHGMAVAEVGCWIGETMMNYAECVKNNDGIIYAIDWFKGGMQCAEDTIKKTHSYSDDQKIQDETYSKFLANVEKYIQSGHIKVLKGLTSEMVNLIPDKSLDICFIDANHTYQFVLEDIRNYLPKIKNGGILCGHDCESLQWANSFSELELSMDTCPRVNNSKRPYYLTVHAGVIQAVYDTFGNDVEMLDHKPGYGNCDHVWVKYL